MDFERRFDLFSENLCHERRLKAALEGQNISGKNNKQKADGIRSGIIFGKCKFVVFSPDAPKAKERFGNVRL